MKINVIRKYCYVFLAVYSAFALVFNINEIVAAPDVQAVFSQKVGSLGIMLIIFLISFGVAIGFMSFDEDNMSK